VASHLRNADKVSSDQKQESPIKISAFGGLDDSDADAVNPFRLGLKRDGSRKNAVLTFTIFLNNCSNFFDLAGDVP
jgi:hypothetical protein